MKLLVLVLCLYSEYALIHTYSIKRYEHILAYLSKVYEWISPKVALNNPYLMLAILVFPLVFLMTGIFYFLGSLLYGFIGLILNALVFYYCLGPQNPFYPTVKETMDDAERQSQVSDYFASVNGSLFTVITLYIVLGPIGIIFYRLVDCAGEFSGVGVLAKQISALLAYIPARITALLYLLVGNFQRGMHIYAKMMLLPPSETPAFLSASGIAAAQMKEGEAVSMVFAESLVEHATIVYLVFLAFLTLVAWM